MNEKHKKPLFGRLIAGPLFWGSTGLYANMTPNTVKVAGYISTRIRGRKVPIEITRDQIMEDCQLGTGAASGAIKVIKDIKLFEIETKRNPEDRTSNFYKDHPLEKYDWDKGSEYTLDRKAKRDRTSEYRRQAEESKHLIPGPLSEKPTGEEENPLSVNRQSRCRLVDDTAVGKTDSSLETTRNNKRDISTAENPPSSIKEEFNLYCDYFTELTGRKVRERSSKRLSAYKARRKSFTDVEMRSALLAASADSFLNGENPHRKIYLTVDYILRPDRMEHWFDQSQAKPPEQPGSQLMEDLG